MSYILAALKKADQEHFLGSVPDLATPQETQPVKPRSFRWVWVVFALLILNVALVVMLLKGKAPDNAAQSAAGQVTTEQAVVQTPSPAQQPVVTVAGQAAQPSGQQLPAAGKAGPAPSGAVPVPNEPALPNTGTPTRQGGSVVMLPQRAQPQPAELSVPPQTAPAAPAIQPPAERQNPPAQDWFDLPQSFRNNLEPPRLDVHVYSENPQGRFIMVNLKKYREGDSLPNGMVLEEIQPDGMIMYLNGERFVVKK